MELQKRLQSSNDDEGREPCGAETGFERIARNSGLIKVT